MSDWPKYPKYAMWRGRKVRVLYYESDGRFRILDRNDDQWSVRRDSLTFLNGS